MDRVMVAQAILDALGGENYLEIGVATGSSFIPIRAKRKWGVDPEYILTRKRLAKYAVFDFFGIKTEKLFRMTSDEFFKGKRNMLKAHGIDLCFVDGLHTYEQSLKDVVNALEYMNPNGVILMHDCNPVTDTMAIPATSIDEVIKLRIPGWNGAWSGNVWKAIVHLRSLRDDLSVFVIDCDTGLGIITKGRPTAKLRYSATQIREMDYGYLQARREELLALQPADCLSTFLHQHCVS